MKKFTVLSIAMCFAITTYSGDRSGRITHFKNKYVSIDFDTVYVDCDLDLGSMILLDDTYYIFSRRMFDMANFRDWTDKFYAFSRTGEKLSETDISQIFNSYYYLHSQNDTLVAQIGSRKRASTLYFDKRGQKWKPFGKVDSPLFEDENYYVTSSCSGEWGGTIFFKDKRSGTIYEGSSTCPVKVTEYNGKYYVSNFLGHMRGHSTLYETEDPRNMSIYTGDRPKADKLIGQRECKSTEGMKKWLDIIGSSRTMELLSSFVRNDRLLHLYSDGDDVYICQLTDGDSVIRNVKNSRIQNVYRFKTPMSNNPWIKFSRTNYHQLHLHTDRGNVGVIMEITPAAILVHYVIRRTSSLPVHDME